MGKHILGQVWTCRTFLTNEVRESTLDLSKMNENGDLALADGLETFPNNGQPETRRVSAEARSVGPNLKLTVTAENNDTYKGVLVLQVLDDTVLVVAGKLHVSTSPVEAERRAADVGEAGRIAEDFDQDDPPVVITKP